MKRRVLEIVRCPNCRELLLCSDIGREEPSGEIIEGQLKCKNDHVFPIIGGIPRLLPPDMLAETLQTFHSREQALQSADQTESSQERSVVRRTLRSFSYQWNVFSEMYPHWEANFRSYFEPLVQMRDFEGKLVLDAGCGFGRHAYYASKMGAEVVAIDLSEAVEAAYRNTRSIGDVHVVQADIYNLPLEAQFDLVYCVGVLQHVPDPPVAFGNLAKMLKLGAGVFIWVYGKRKGIYKLVDLARKVSVHLPMWAMFYLTFLLNIASFLFFSLPYKILRSLPILRRCAVYWPFTRYADLPLRAGHADWFDRLAVPSTKYFSRMDVEQWFRDAGLDHLQVVSREGIGWCALGRKSTSFGREGSEKREDMGSGR
jgi:SAM-dependent methyltransferase/uncharacterized protein YbaR (Trm112 family)